MKKTSRKTKSGHWPAVCWIKSLVIVLKKKNRNKKNVRKVQLTLKNQWVGGSQRGAGRLLPRWAPGHSWRRRWRCEWKSAVASSCEPVPASSAWPGHSAALHLWGRGGTVSVKTMKIVVVVGSQTDALLSVFSTGVTVKVDVGSSLFGPSINKWLAQGVASPWPLREDVGWYSKATSVLNANCTEQSGWELYWHALFKCLSESTLGEIPF